MAWRTFGHDAMYTVENHVTSKQRQWRIPLKKKTIDSGKTFYDISTNTGQIYIGLKQILRKMTATCLLYVNFVQRSG